MVRTYYQQRAEDIAGPIAVGRRASAPLSDAERRRLAEEEQKRILDEQIAEKRRERMQQQAREQAEIIDHYRNYQLAGATQSDRDLEAFIQEKQRQPVMFQPPPPAPANDGRSHAPMAKYGAFAAQVTDKMETERDRRLRLRAEERAAARRPSITQAARAQQTPRTAAQSKRDQMYEEKRRMYAERQQQNGPGVGRTAEPRVVRAGDDMFEAPRRERDVDEEAVHAAWERDMQDVRDMRRAVVYASNDPLPSAAAPRSDIQPSVPERQAPPERAVIPMQDSTQEQRLAKKADYARELREQMEQQAARKQRHPAPSTAEVGTAGLVIGERERANRNAREAKEAYARELREQMEARRLHQERERQGQRAPQAAFVPQAGSPPSRMPQAYAAPAADPLPRRPASHAEVQHMRDQLDQRRMHDEAAAAEAARRKAEYARELQMQIDEKKARMQAASEQLKRAEQRPSAQPQLRVDDAYGDSGAQAGYAEGLRAPQHMPNEGYDYHDTYAQAPPRTYSEQQQQQPSNQIARDLQLQMQEKHEREMREKARREAEDRRIAAESAAYFPFGRGGSGAPLRDAHGNAVTRLRDIRMANLAQVDGRTTVTPDSAMPAFNEPPYQQMAPQPMQLQQQQQPYHPSQMVANQPPSMLPTSPVGQTFVRQGFQLMAEQQVPEEVLRRQRQRQELQDALRQQVEAKKALQEREKRLREEEERRDQERVEREQALLQQRYQRDQDHEHKKTEIGGAAGNVAVVVPHAAAVNIPPVVAAPVAVPPPALTEAQKRRERAMAARAQQQQRMDMMAEQDVAPERSRSPPIPSLRDAVGTYEPAPMMRAARHASPPPPPPPVSSVPMDDDDSYGGVRDSVERISGFNDRSTRLQQRSAGSANDSAPSSQQQRRSSDSRPGYARPVNRERDRGREREQDRARESAHHARRSPGKHTQRHSDPHSATAKQIEEWQKEMEQRQKTMLEHLQEQNKKMQQLQQLTMQAIGRETDIRTSLDEQRHERRYQQQVLGATNEFNAVRHALPDATRDAFLRRHPSPVTDVDMLEQQQASLLKQQERDLQRVRQRPPTGRRRGPEPVQQSFQERPGTAQSGVDWDSNFAQSTLVRPTTADLGMSLVAETRFLLPTEASLDVSGVNALESVQSTFSKPDVDISHGRIRPASRGRAAPFSGSELPSPIKPAAPVAAASLVSETDLRRDSIRSEDLTTLTSATNTTTINIDKLDAINAERLRILEEMTHGDTDQARLMLDDYLQEQAERQRQMPESNMEESLAGHTSFV